VADIVRPGDFPGRLAGVAPLQGLALRAGDQLRLAAHLHAAGFGEFAALTVARADQLASVGRKSEAPSAIFGCIATVPIRHPSLHTRRD